MKSIFHCHAKFARAFFLLLSLILTFTTALVPAFAATDTVWIEDALPSGAITGGDSESWNWVSASPAPFSGSLAHQSNLVGGEHQHYFYGASTLFSINTGDTLFAYVYLDPSSPPTEVMLQWHDAASGWEHRAYWGGNTIPFGVDGTTSRKYMGTLPATGGWVRLNVPASAVGLEGISIDGMAFTLWNGKATWDKAGKSTGTTSSPTIDTPSLPNGTVGATYNQTLAVSGGSAPYVWSIASGSLPPGLSLSVSGVISGAPTTAGTSNFTVRVQENGGANTTKALTINIAAASGSDTVWIEDALPSGAITGGDSESWNWVSSSPAPFSGSLAHQSNLVGGEHQHYFYGASTLFSINTGDTLFAYVYLDPSSPPTEVMLQWHDAASGWEHRAYWGGNTIPFGVDGTTSRKYMGTLPATGGWVRLNVPASAVGLEGISIDGMAFTLWNGKATWDKAGKSTGTTSSPTIDTPSLPNGTVGASYNQTLAVSGGSAPYVWSIASGSLPPGLSLSVSGVISGTPTTAGTSNFTVRVQENGGGNTTKAFTIVVNPGVAPLTINTTTLAGGIVGTTYSQTLAASGGTTPYTWSVVTGSLPSGLTLNSASGAISGTPTATGTSSFVIKVQDSASTSVNSLTLSITISASGASTGPINYIYDEVGRLVGASDSLGNSAQYTYDPVGNLLSITRTSAGTVKIIEFTPDSAEIGESVTISGTGFSATASQNTVKFNGTVANVTSASSSVLQVIVPVGATSGPISVTSPSGSATSASNFIVAAPGSGNAPIITSFTPTIGSAGSTVTIIGNNFQTTAANNKVTLNGVPLKVTAVTSTSLTVTIPAVVGSGKIKVTTAYGTASTNADYYFVPSPYTAANVEVATRMANPGSQNIAISTAGKVALILFNGTNGQRIGLFMSGVTIPNSTVTIYRPDGVVYSTVSVSTAGGSIGVAPLPVSGTYTILVAPVSGGTGNMSLQLGAPDLVISGVTIGTVVANANGSYGIPVTYTVTNNGTITAQPSWYDLGYLSTDGVLDNADQSLSGYPYHSTALAPGASYTFTTTYTTSTTTAAGAYTLFVKTDGHAAAVGGSHTDTGNLVEANETNNVVGLSISLSRPDLVISGVTIGTVVANANGSYGIPVTYTVTNNGTITAQPSWYDLGYLSTDGVLDNADQSLSGYPYHSTALAPGASYTFTTTYTTSTTTAAGAYTLFVKTDGHAAAVGGSHTDTGNLVEANETNNVVGLSISLSRPDLVISGVTIGTVVANANGSYGIPVTYTVTNNGTITAQPSWYDLGYLSTDGVLDNADQSLSGYPYHSTALAPGASYTFTTTYTTSTTTAAGAYTLFVKTDGHAAAVGGSHTDTGNLVEANETNNVVGLSISLSRPDLVISGVTIGTVVANANGSYGIPVTYTVTNNGTITAQPSWYDLGYLSTDGVLDNADQSLSGYPYHSTALAPGASYTFTTTYTTSTTTAAGAYTLFVKTDGHAAAVGGSHTDTGNLVEANETNNVVGLSISLSRPDLVISGVTIGTVVANANGSYGIPVTYTVTNNGTITAQPSWYDLGYLSTDGVLDNADQSLSGYPYHSTALAPGASYTFTTTYTTSTTTAAGAYTLFVKTDGHAAAVGGSHTDTGNLVEANETNNVVGLSISLSRPDLVISGVTIGTVVANANGSYGIPVTYTVTNNGTITAQPSWYDLGYLSTDGVLDNADQSLSGYPYHSTALAPGASYTFTTTYTTSTTTAAGAYTLFVKTDGHAAAVGGSHTDTGNLVEANETNNVVGLSISLSRPDLVISGVTIGTVVANANGSYGIPVTYTVTNNGTITAQPSWYDLGYLSTDGVLDNADQSLSGYPYHSTALAPGASYTFTTTYTTSTTTAAGAYTLFVKTDGHAAAVGGSHTDTGNLVEANETNNIQAKPLSLP